MGYYTMNTVNGCSCCVSCALNHESWGFVHVAYHLALPLSQPSASPLQLILVSFTEIPQDHLSSVVKLFL